MSVLATYTEFKDHLTQEEEAEYQRLLAGPSPQQIIISFVDCLERAHQYLEFLDYLQNDCAFIKADSKGKDVFLDLIMKPERKARFSKLDEKTISQSIYDHIRKLHANQIRRTKLLVQRHFLPVQEERRLEMYHQPNEWRQVDHIPFSDPTIELINQARKGYLLHQNPQVELDKMKESHPLFYEDKFIMDMVTPETQYSERTVTVVNLSNEHTDEKLKELLSVCGEVEKIERTSSFVWSEIAHVTFKNTEAAKIVPFAMDPHLISVQRMFKCFVSKIFVETVEDVSSMHDRMVAKYKDLRLYYMQRQK